jgi:formylglycine-generating enzyme required for sulfatase activity
MAQEIPAAMKFIRGGSFTMGSNVAYPDEAPERRVTVPDFWIDVTPVTNYQFARFVADTGYVTFAELPPDASQYPGMLPEMARAGSLVFVPPRQPVAASEGAVWWQYVFGACWKHPLGPGSSIEAIMEHPVVHITPADANAYAQWAGKILPTEAQWEFAARGALEGRTYAWGDELEPHGVPMARIWRGVFPHINEAPAGLERTSPVGSYPPNGYGLYDMIGNVWEWTADPYRANPSSAAGSPSSPQCCGAKLQGAEESQQHAGEASVSMSIPLGVVKGGSHLCAPNYCQRYRPSARWPQPIDTSTSHIGFRCMRLSAP